MSSTVFPAAAAGSTPAAPRFSVLCLSPQPWAVSLPTNRQQIMRILAERGHDVVYVHAAGFVGRGLGRGATPAAVSLPWRVRTLTPANLVPFGRKYATSQRLNSRLGARAVARAAAALPRPLVVWVYDPCATRLASRLDADLLVYDCVDDYVQQVGGDRHRAALVTRCERELVYRSDLVFTTAKPLYERHRAVNPGTFLVPNVADVGHFGAGGTEPPEELAGLPRPLVGFAGNFLENKVDLELLAAAAQARRTWTFVLIGPASGRERAVEALAEAPNVVWLGPRPYAELPRYIARFDVALIPYLANEYTRSCFPLKLYEYLAAGKPVVATGLPELGGMEPDVATASGAEELVARVEAALRRRSTRDDARRRELASGHSWEARAGRLAELVDAALVEGDPAQLRATAISHRSSAAGASLRRTISS